MERPNIDAVIKGVCTQLVSMAFLFIVTFRGVKLAKNLKCKIFYVCYILFVENFFVFFCWLASFSLEFLLLFNQQLQLIQIRL